MSDPSTRLPAGRHVVAPSRRTPSARHAGATTDVIEAIEAVAKRVSMPLVSESGTPQRILVAGVPLVAAALVATGNTPASAATNGSALAGPSPALPTGAVSAGAPRVHAPSGPASVTYRVKEGDTVAHIAERTGLTVRAIIQANHLSPTGLIRPGQVLVLPGLTVPGTAAPKPAAARPAAARPAARKPAARRPAPAPDLRYVVRPGDTLAGIAERYKLALPTLAQANKIANPSLIHPGQVLRLPGVAAPARRPAPKPTPPPTRPYTVKPGDSLIGISEAQKVPLKTLLTLNRLTTAAVIHPGQVVRLPAPPKPKPARSDVPNTFAGRTYPDSVARAAAANRATLARRTLPSRAQMRAMVQATANRMGVDPTLALAVAWQESGFNPAVVSPANAIGTMQVIPSTGVWASDLVGRRLDLLVPQDNVTAGVAVLAALLARAEEEDAIAGYYQGLASVRGRGMFEDTKAYVANIQAHRKRFAAELAADA